MYPKIEGYLTPPEVQSVERWTAPIRTLIDRHPKLKEVDLVIEGGIGRGQTMPHIVRTLFQKALYIGTDLSQSMFSKSKLVDNIPQSELDNIIQENNRPSITMKGAIIRANCFDGNLVSDIAKKTNRHSPMLVAWRALNAFLNNDLSREEKKGRDDRTTCEDIVNPTGPYRAQLYLMEYPLDETDDHAKSSFVNAYLELKQIAETNGWQTNHEEDWLLLVR